MIIVVSIYFLTQYIQHIFIIQNIHRTTFSHFYSLSFWHSVSLSLYIVLRSFVSLFLIVVLPIFLLLCSVYKTKMQSRLTVRAERKKTILRKITVLYVVLYTMYQTNIMMYTNFEFYHAIQLSSNIHNFISFVLCVCG